MRWAVVLSFLLTASPALAHGGDIHLGTALPFLALGFLVGLAHALDADHVAAVAAMIEDGGSQRSIMARGAAWGLGHTAALFVICSTVLLMGLTISETVGAAVELAVGILIVLLGLRVLWKLARDRVHIHVHDHDGTRHAHAHSHAGDADDHSVSRHTHSHNSAKALLPTLGVGLIHGAAGSAGLLVLIVASAESTVQALAAFGLFGLGSLLGMTGLTAAASYPLGYIHRGAGWMRTALALSVGALALVVGTGVAITSFNALQLAAF